MLPVHASGCFGRSWNRKNPIQQDPWSPVLGSLDFSVGRFPCECDRMTVPELSLEAKTKASSQRWLNVGGRSRNGDAVTPRVFPPPTAGCTSVVTIAVSGNPELTATAPMAAKQPFQARRVTAGRWDGHRQESRQRWSAFIWPGQSRGTGVFSPLAEVVDNRQLWIKLLWCSAPNS